MADHDCHRWFGHATNGLSVFSIPPYSRIISRGDFVEWNSKNFSWINFQGFNYPNVVVGNVSRTSYCVTVIKSYVVLGVPIPFYAPL